jgi:DNA-binding NarL/FixJ family response regulator
VSEAFVGRTHEFAQVRQAVDAARAGTGRTALVVGEAGIGKTRLASQVINYARDAGFEVLVGRCIDLVGTELPYQPFVEALRGIGGLRRGDAPTAGSQLEVFEQALALLTERATAAPVLLVLEDVHWADISTLDLVVFLAHHLVDRRVVLLATGRADEPASGERVRRFVAGVRRSGAASIVELGPLTPDELAELLAARTGGSLPATLMSEIVDRCDGNPFFAEEILAAAGADTSAGAARELPRGLRDLLLQRLAPLDPATLGVLRLAAAAGRHVGYPLLRALAARPEGDLRESLRAAVAHGVLVAVPATGSYRFRHALLAEAVYATLLPGEREELHASLAEELARGPAAAPGELAPHWVAAGRTTEALAASVEAARQAQAVFGLAEALAHLERALSMWAAVPDAAQVARVELAELCSWTAELAWHTGAAPRAVELARREIDLVGHGDPLRAAQLHERLGRYLYASGRGDAALAAIERAVELLPEHPPSAQRAQALTSLAGGLGLDWRHEESLAICEQALALARAVGDHQTERRALTLLGSELAYLGRGDEGLAQLEQVLRVAETSADHVAREGAYVALTDTLLMLGRPRESARLAGSAFEVLRPFGRAQSTLAANRIEALVASGDWDSAERVSAAALRAITANYPHQPLTARAELEAGRGQFDQARTHLDTARATLHLDRDLAAHATIVAELALWECRWTDAEQIVTDGLARARSRGLAQIRARLAAKGLRAQAELAALARARRDDDAVRSCLARARELVTVARHAAADTVAITPNAAGWLALAGAEYERARGLAQPGSWSNAAAEWERLERPPLAAYCHWRQTEALVATGAPGREASGPLRKAHAVAAGIAALPLLHELELLAARARLELAPPPPATAHHGGQPLAAALGLTQREAEVLTLIARGHTNREIAGELVISIRTAGVHVSRILHKLGATNRLEAAAIAHRSHSARSGHSPLDP